MEKVKIKNIFDFQKKSKIKAGDGFKLGEAQYPFYTSSNELTKSINEYLFEDESLIFGTGGLASIHFCNEKFAVSTDCFVIQPKDKKRVFSKFVYYYLSGNMNILENGFKGAGLKHISKDYLENIEIPLPNLATQQRIAAILDQADAIIQNNRAIVQKYDALTQSLFLDMFGDPVKNEKGWEVFKLSQLSDITSSRRIFKDEYVDNGIPFYRTKEIVELSKNKKITSELYISVERYNEIKSSNNIPQIGDILLSAVGTIGVMWIVNNDNPFYFKDGNLIWLKMAKSKNINSKYLIMTLEYLIEFEKGNLAQGAAYNALTIDKLKQFNVSIAPIPRQNQFAERVELIEAQKQQAQLELAKSEELFQSLLQRAFKGELN